MKTTINDEKKDLSLYIPRVEDYWFEAKLMNDPLTMSYNAGYDVFYDGYHYDSGCIAFPEEKWVEKYQQRVKEKRYFAYIRDNKINEYVGYCNYQYNAAEKRYECGIVIAAEYRGRGYSKAALQLLCRQAKNEGIAELYDNFEEDRLKAKKVFEDVGFRVVRKTHWQKFGQKTVGVEVKICLSSAEGVD